MNLETLSQAIKSNFTQLQESEIIGRIMIISGRDFERSVKGYELLIAQKLLPETFVEPETKGKFFALLDARPHVRLLFQRLDCIPGKLKPIPGDLGNTIQFLPPPKLSAAEILERLKFSNLDF